MDRAERLKHSTKTLISVRKELSKIDELLDNRACVYATGSFGRLEAGLSSDLDLFIAAQGKNGEVDAPLGRLDEICVKAALIDAVRKLKLPDFDIDGEFLKQYTPNSLEENIGQALDDSSNTFTARLLLLLESNPIIGDDAYNAILNHVIQMYWKDYDDHSNNFMPIFLANDIQRYWRTLCVSYEAKRPRNHPEGDAKRRKARVKLYKLKYSRNLTCHSALLCMLNEFACFGSVTPQKMHEISRMSPTIRIDYLQQETGKAMFNQIARAYDEFLMTSAVGDECLASKLDDATERKELFYGANEFSLLVADAMINLGQKNEMFRRMLV